MADVNDSHSGTPNTASGAELNKLQADSVDRRQASRGTAQEKSEFEVNTVSANSDSTRGPAVLEAGPTIPQVVKEPPAGRVSFEIQGHDQPGIPSDFVVLRKGQDRSHGNSEIGIAGGTPNSNPPESSAPKEGPEAKGQAQRSPEPLGRSAVVDKGIPVSSAPLIKPVETSPGKTTDTTRGAVNESRVTGPTADVKSDPGLNPGEARSIPAGADPRPVVAKPAEFRKVEAQNERERTASVSHPVSQSPGDSFGIKADNAKLPPAGTEVVPRANGQARSDVFARSTIPVENQSPGVEGQARVKTVLPDPKPTEGSRANRVLEAPVQTHLNAAETQIKNSAANRVSIEPGGNLEPSPKAVSPAPARTVPLADAGSVGGDAKATNPGPADVNEVGVIKAPTGRVDGGKINTTGNDGKPSEGTSANEGTKFPPKVPQSDGTRKPITTAPSDGVGPTGTSAAGPKIADQISGGKQPAPKSDGVKSQPDSVGDKAQGQAPGASKPEIVSATDGKTKAPEAKFTDTKVTGSKADSGTKIDSANEGKTSKVVSPTAGGKGEARTQSGERPDPRAGKERATPQADSGSHVDTGRAVKGPRETATGTWTPSKRGDVREPADPASRGDRVGKTDIGNRGDKQSQQPSAEAGGKDKRGDSKVSADDGGKKQNAIGDREAGSSKGTAGAKENAGIRRPEFAGTTDGAGSRSTDVSGTKGTAKADASGIKAGEGSRNPSDAKADGSRTPQAGIKVGEGSRNPSGAKADGSRTPQAGSNVGEGSRISDPIGGKMEGSRTPQAGAKVGEGLRNPDAIAGKADGSRTPEVGVRAGEGFRSLEPSGAKGDGSRTPVTGPKAVEGIRTPDVIGGGKIGDAPHSMEPGGFKLGDGVRPGGRVGDGSRNPEAIGAKVGEGTRLPESGVRQGDISRNPEIAGAKGVGIRKPQTAEGKVGNSATPPSGGIKTGAKEQGIIKPLDAKDGAVQKGSGSDAGVLKGSGQKSPFAPFAGSDQKTSFGLKDWIATKKTEGTEKQSKLDPSKIEAGKTGTPQSKLSGILIERGLPSIAKAQSERTRGIKPGAKIDSAQPASLDDRAIKTPLRPAAESVRAPVTAELSKFITLKLDSNRLPQVESPGKVSAEPTVVLSVARRFSGGLLELPVAAKVIDTARVTPVLNLEATKSNAAGRELSSTIRGQRLTLPGEPATKTFAKHQPEGQTAKLPQVDSALAGLKADTVRGGSERVDSLLPKARKEQTSSGEVPSDKVPHSIRDVFRKFQLALPKRSFSPEITESGNYVAQRGQSSQRLQAFISSGTHKALREQNSSLDARKTIRNFEYDIGTLDKSEEESDDESNLEVSNSADSMFAKAATTAGTGHNAQHDSVRKVYVVQAGDTPRSIAVVQLNDHLLENLIVEINELVFQQAYDPLQEMHVKILPVGAMILLPNKKDVEEFRDR